MRVARRSRRYEGFLDRARARPAQQVERGTGLVVGAGRAAAAEGLLADHGTGGLVVDVEVPGGEAQRLGGVCDRGTIARVHGTGERVWRDVLHLLEHALVVTVFVDVHGQDRAEVLGAEHVVLWVRAGQQGWPDEEAVRVVGATA